MGGRIGGPSCDCEGICWRAQQIQERRGGKDKVRTQRLKTVYKLAYFSDGKGSNAIALSDLCISGKCHRCARPC